MKKHINYSNEFIRTIDLAKETRRFDSLRKREARLAKKLQAVEEKLYVLHLKVLAHAQLLRSM